jgi:raffinose/stachyose/melibiose transport system permease protein
VLTSESSASLVLGIMNSLLVTTIGVSILIVLGSVTAYVLSRKMSRLSKVAFYMVLVGIIVPAQLGIVPIFIGARSLGLLGNLPGLGLIYGLTLLPLAIFLYAGFVRGIPTDYEEAAFIDGSSRIKTFFRIVFPLLAPATGTVAIMSGIIMWNDFFTPLIFLNGSESPTIGLVIYQYVGSSIVVEWNLIFALLILAMIPIVILYLVFQKNFIQGFSGGIKS